MCTSPTRAGTTREQQTSKDRQHEMSKDREHHNSKDTEHGRALPCHASVAEGWMFHDAVCLSYRHTEQTEWGLGFGLEAPYPQTTLLHPVPLFSGCSIHDIVPGINGDGHRSRLGMPGVPPSLPITWKVSSAQLNCCEGIRLHLRSMFYNNVKCFVQKQLRHQLRHRETLSPSEAINTRHTPQGEQARPHALTVPSAQATNARSMAGNAHARPRRPMWKEKTEACPVRGAAG